MAPKHERALEAEIDAARFLREALAEATNRKGVETRIAPPIMAMRTVASADIAHTRSALLSPLKMVKRP